MRPRDMLALALIFVVVFGVGAAFVYATVVGLPQLEQGEAGYPVPWQLNFQLPAAPLQQDLYDLHNLLFVVNVAITALVFVLLAFIVWRFRASRNPTPTRLTHNTSLEVLWTVVPVFILVAISIPTFRALWALYTIPETAELTVKVTGRQWYWDYAYPDHGIEFSSLMLQDDELPADRRHLRLLAVDNPLVLPVGRVVRFQVTGGDVLHAFPVPSLGIRRDAVPGRLNEAWTLIEREGSYYGQCSELCGTNHAYMPIEIRAVSPQAFEAFLAGRRQSARATPGAPPS